MGVSGVVLIERKLSTSTQEIRLLFLPCYEHSDKWQMSLSLAVSSV